MLKTDFMVKDSRQTVASHFALFNTELERLHSIKYIGVNIDEYLTCDNHVKHKAARKSPAT